MFLLFLVYLVPGQEILISRHERLQTDIKNKITPGNAEAGCWKLYLPASCGCNQRVCVFDLKPSRDPSVKMCVFT